MALLMLLPPSMGVLRASARASVLTEWLSNCLECEVTVEVASSYGQLVAAVFDRTADLVWAPPSVCAEVGHRALAMFKAVRGGRASYCAAIVARRDGPASIQDLAGTTPAWVDPRSVGGYLAAIAHLRREGLDPDRDLAPGEFHGSYGDALRVVLAGTAGFTSTFSPAPNERATLYRLQLLVGERADDLAVLGHTPMVPSDALLVTRRAVQDHPEVLERLIPLIDGSAVDTLLLSVLDADRLEPTVVDEYESLR